jgi:hypothetical protein
VSNAANIAEVEASIPHGKQGISGAAHACSERPGVRAKLKPVSNGEPDLNATADSARRIVSQLFTEHIQRFASPLSALWFDLSKRLFGVVASAAEQNHPARTNLDLLNGQIHPGRRWMCCCSPGFDAVRRIVEPEEDTFGLASYVARARNFVDIGANKMAKMVRTVPHGRKALLTIGVKPSPQG